MGYIKPKEAPLFCLIESTDKLKVVIFYLLTAFQNDVPLEKLDNSLNIKTYSRFHQSRPCSEVRYERWKESTGSKMRHQMT